MPVSTAPAIMVDQEAIEVRPDPVHEFILETAAVAAGYGVSDLTVRRHKQEHADELLEGKHWVVQKLNTLGGRQSATFWTKRGIVRLGFFIKSDRARRFRDAAEDLIVSRPASAPSPLERRLDALEHAVRALLDTQRQYLQAAIASAPVAPAAPYLANPRQLPAPGSEERQHCTSIGISIRPDTYEQAMARARQLGMSWSGYVRHCLESEQRATFRQPPPLPIMGPKQTHYRSRPDNPSRLLVLAILTANAGPDRIASLPARYIAEQVNITPRYVRSLLDDLQESGEIEILHNDTRGRKRYDKVRLALPVSPLPPTAIHGF